MVEARVQDAEEASVFSYYGSQVVEGMDLSAGGVDEKERSFESFYVEGCNHYSILRPPHALHLARRMQKWMEGREGEGEGEEEEGEGEKMEGER